MRRDDPLAAFHPVIGRWFRETYGEPTDVQRQVWPEIADGSHVLATAPTGSGKTLAAFLFSLDRLLTGQWEGEGVRVLYVSPLKALNNDIARNLLVPLEQLGQRFREEGLDARALEVRVRSGDTPARERRAMLRRPPEILITTPESLNVLLTSDAGRELFTSLKTVILDEIHAVAGTKRGTHLITAVERLVELSGEFQRLALSATIRPLPRIARFVGGYRLKTGAGTAAYEARRVKIVESKAEKKLDLQVERVPRGGSGDDDKPWAGLVKRLAESIAGGESTLVFANSRRMAEKIARLLSEQARGVKVYSHHGSLAREIREVVERRLKDGELDAIVATSSLELGIDVGAVSDVLLIQTPKSVAAALQRIGRSGHRVGETSRGRFFPLADLDLLDAAAVAEAVSLGEVEEISPVNAPLDVLAQVLLSMTSGRTWDLSELFDTVRSADPYHDLPRRHFDLVLEMLAGRCADGRLRDLTPRVTLDRVAGTIRARPGARLHVYLSGGTIPDRGYLTLRVHDSRAKLGELDEEFVWERSVGDRFVFGAQSWTIVQIGHNEVLVSPAQVGAGFAPFWRAEALDRSFFLSHRIGELLEWIEEERPPLTALEKRCYLTRETAEELQTFLDSQRAATRSPLPHRHHLLVERIEGRGAGESQKRVLLHTGWGGRVNRPFAAAMEAAWERRFPGEPLETLHDDHCVLLQSTLELTRHEILGLVASHQVEELLRQRLEGSAFYGARFREAAGRALLLPRSGGKRRVPLWLTRQRAKALYAAVSSASDFPIRLEAWRACLQDEMDLPSLRRVLDELAQGEIRVTECLTPSPSPMASNLSWKVTNELMYDDDAAEGEERVPISAELYRELVYSSELRPEIPEHLVRLLLSKLHRIHPGYAPAPEELVDWVQERLVIPEEEWRDLLGAVARDHGEEDLDEKVQWDRMVAWERPHGRVVCAVESLPRMVPDVAETLARGSIQLSSVREREQPPAESVLRWLTDGSFEANGDGTASSSEALVGEWLRYYGPVVPRAVAEALNLSPTTLDESLATLSESGTVVVDRLVEGSRELEVCDGENLGRLLRMLRTDARAQTETQTRELAELQPFLAAWQGLAGSRARSLDEGELQCSLERLFLFPARAGAWEEEILPARLERYEPSWLDGLLQETELLWLGCGRERLTLLLESDWDLAGMESREEAQEPQEDFFTGLLKNGRLDSAEAASRLWEKAWQGQVTNDLFAAVRQGLVNRFQAQPVAEKGPRRSRFGKWKASRPFLGRWHGLPDSTEPEDALEKEERNRERVSILLDRYGVLFRELLARELPALRWSPIFRALLLMELSGEVLTGRFFHGIPGPQFLAPGALRLFQENMADDVLYWINATDPASLCGVDLPELKSSLPRRLPGTHLVFLGTRLVLVSLRQGKDLEIRLEPDHPALAGCFDFLAVQLTRRFSPRRHVEIETINGTPAPGSPYLRSLAERFHVTSGATSVRLWKRY